MVTLPLASEFTAEVPQFAGEFPVIQTATSTSFAVVASISEARTSAGNS